MRILKGMAAMLAAGMMMMAVAPAAHANWLAVVAGASDQTASAGVGWNAPTRHEAIRAAGQGCVSDYACRVQYVWQGPGCVFVTSGTSPYTGQAKWAMGVTPQDAVNNCANGGFVCRYPTGGCNDY